MRTIMLLGWLLVPVVGAAYHYGPGQEQMRLDGAATTLADAQTCASQDDWAGAADHFDAALAQLPPDRTADLGQARLERAKAWMNSGKLPEAFNDLQAMVTDLQTDEKADPRLLADARAALANSQYYVTWLMKLEGRPRDDWEPEIESSRQTFRLLAEQATEAGDSSAVKQHSEDVESAIRLARMDPSDLQGLAPPKQCQGCKSGNCKKPGRKPGMKPGKPQDSRGAGSGPPPDGAGS